MKILYEYVERFSPSIALTIRITRDEVAQRVYRPENTQEQNEEAVDRYLAARSAKRVYDISMNEYQARVCADAQNERTIPQYANDLDKLTVPLLEKLASYDQSKPSPEILVDLGGLVGFVAHLANKFGLSLSELVELYNVKR